jgi:hypothetical protein
MMPTPGPPSKREGVGAVNEPRGDTGGLGRRRQRRRAGAERLQALGDTHPPGPIAVAWDHAAPQAAEEIDALGRAAAGR